MYKCKTILKIKTMKIQIICSREELEEKEKINLETQDYFQIKPQGIYEAKHYRDTNLFCYFKAKNVWFTINNKYVKPIN